MIQVKLPEGWESWRLEEVLGVGSYGTVYKASSTFGGSTIYSAIKIIHVPDNENEFRAMVLETGSVESARAFYKENVKEFIQEIAAMNALKGITNIVSVEDSRIQENEDKSGWNY